MLLATGSVKLAPEGITIFAVLLKFPVFPAAPVPLIVIVNVLPAPLLTDIPVYLTLFPVVAFVPQLAVPADAQLTVSPIMDAGTLSTTLNPDALLGPALETTIW